jgi:hypothetical protein
VVFIFLSVNSIVIPPANTGKDSNSNTAVIKTDQRNSGSLKKSIPHVLEFITVVIKLIAPRIDEIPAICKLIIAQSTEPPGCPKILLKGGYTVHPVPAP